MHNLSFIDKVLCNIDIALRSLIPPQRRPSMRPFPAANIPLASLLNTQKKHVAGLMRVNHAGEVSAQALYQGQALTTHCHNLKHEMQNAALEEIDHLAWCEQRLQELGSSPSFLNPIWYFGSLLIGMLAGLLSQNISLGFIAETEEQVSLHLKRHIQDLPYEDERSKVLLEQIIYDETLHKEWALNKGACELPIIIKQLMGLMSQCMTRTSYYF